MKFSFSGANKYFDLGAQITPFFVHHFIDIILYFGVMLPHEGCV